VSWFTPQGGKRDPLTGFDAADAIKEWKDIEALRGAAHGLAKAFDTGPRYHSYAGYASKMASWEDVLRDAPKGAIT
jgi:hypothetical protein